MEKNPVTGSVKKNWSKWLFFSHSGREWIMMYQVVWRQWAQRQWVLQRVGRTTLFLRYIFLFNFFLFFFLFDSSFSNSPIGRLYCTGTVIYQYSMNAHNSTAIIKRVVVNAIILFSALKRHRQCWYVPLSTLVAAIVNISSCCRRQR